MRKNTPARPTPCWGPFGAKHRFPGVRLGADNRMWRMSTDPTPDWISITESPLSPDELSNWVIRPNCGAIVTFSGVVRDHSKSRENVIALDYETDTVLAEGRLREVVREARIRWPDLERVAIHHRIGQVDLSESTVVVAVSAPHRDG